MPLFIADNNPGFKKPVALSCAEAHHLVTVCRAKPGDTVKLTDNQGTLAWARIKTITPLTFEVIKTEPGESPSPITVHLPLIAKTKLESAVEKLTELNIQTVQLTITHRCQLKSLSQKALNRLKKIATAAQKQCERAYPLVIGTPKPVAKIKTDPKEMVFVGIPHLKFEIQNPKIKIQNAENGSIHIFVGPEGGFTDDEIKFLEEKGAQSINLGKTTLRTETAALVLTTLIKYTTKPMTNDQ